MNQPPLQITKFIVLVIFLTTSAFYGQAQVSITCPSDILEPSNDPGICGAIVNFTAPVGTGSGTGLTTTLTSVLGPGSTFPVGVTEVTYTVTNNEGDVANCSFFVTVEDDEEPVFTCPGDIMVNADPVTCEAVVFFVTPSASDNCGPPTVIQIGGLPSGSSFPIGESNLDFQAVDAAGNLAFCRVKVIVMDDTDPVITCPADISVDVTASCSAVVNYVEPVGVDECTISNTVQTAGLGSGSSFPVGTTIEEFTVTDLQGNTASCSFSITVNDIAPPNIACPGDLSVVASPGDCDAVVNFPNPVFTDNCPGAVIGQSGGPSSGSVFPLGSTEVQFTAIDVSGLFSICTFNIIVTEDEVPQITCPPNIVVNSDPGSCGATVIYTEPIGTDNCPGASTSLTMGLGSGAFFPIGVSTEEWTVTDESGNETSCTFTIEVLDNEAPVISCPPDISTSADPGSCSATVSFSDATATDNCPGVTITQTSGLNSGDDFPVGVNTVEFTAEDASGNTSTCIVTIEVLDTELPQITCPSDQNISIPGGFCSGIVNYPAPSVIDNCPGVSINVLSGPSSGSSVGVGTYVVELEAEDASGNIATCSFNLNVTETSDPVFTCPSDLTINNQAGSCEAIVNFASPTATDSCSTVTVTQTAGFLSGTAFPVGTNTVEFTAEDEYGNTSMCSFDIIVEDIELPTINCQADIIATADPGLCETVVNFSLPIATDNCPGVIVTQTGGPTSGSPFPVGTTSVQFTATDQAGNTSVCDLDVIVEDTELPQITCPGDLNIEIPGGFCSTAIAYADPVVTDNCPGEGFNLMSGPASGDVLNAGVYTVTYEAFDVFGNTSECSFIITITETSDPVFSCPADIQVSNDPGLCEAVVTFAAPLATDSCSTVNVSQITGPSSGASFPVGTTVVEFLAEDPFGNSSTCSFNIIVEDDEPPVIDCPSTLVQSTDLGECSAIVTFSTPSFTDNCPGGSITQTGGPVSGSVLPVGTTPIEFTAQDAAGNTSVCSFDITVQDTEAPSIVCPTPMDFEIPGGFCSGQVTYPDPVISDNCPGASFVVLSGPASGDVVPAGVYTVSLQAIDAAGNTQDCSFTLTVTESSFPVFDCPLDITAPADPGSCEAIVTFPDPLASDSCSFVTVNQISGPLSGAVFAAGSTTVEFQAIDAFGNASFCSFDVIVIDDTDPTITCPDDITTNNDLGACGASINYTVPVGDDNCGVLSVTQIEGIGPGNFFPVGVTTETYQVEDVSGNTSTCSFTITVVDTEAPQLTCPADIDIVLPDGDCDIVVNYTPPVVSDNCPGVTVSLIDGPTSGSIVDVGTTTVTYEAIDIEGNSSTCSFLITITENVLPEITCPSDITVDADQDVCNAIVTYMIPVGTDNCPGATTTQIAGLGSGSSFPIGINTETYSVTDASGNEVTCSFDIIVLDAEAPTLDCNSDITVSNDPGVCGAVVTFDNPIVNDNCSINLVSTQIEGPSSGSLFTVGTTLVTFEAVDDSGNSATCSFNVIVVDDELPEITCPAPIILNAPSGDCSTTGTFTDPVFTDNCPGTLLDLVSGLPSGSDFPVGINEVVFEVTDASGNSAQCSFTVTVLEDVDPVIDCPDDIMVSTDLGMCGAVVDYEVPIGVDNCGGATTSLVSGQAPGTFFDVGTTTITYEVVDLSGNEASCSFTITVNDEEPPAFECPEALTFSTAEGECEFEYTFSPPEATDNCTTNLNVIQTEGPASGALLPPGVTNFVFETEDEAGNSSSCSYSVTVVDDIDPIFISCPNNFVAEITEGCSVEVTFPTPEAEDNCGVTVTQTQGPASGDDLSPGVYPVTFLATDDSGNEIECSFEIQVIDNIPPEITCPDEFETCSNQPEFENPTAIDNCDVASLIQISGPSSGDVFPEGETTIVFEAIDVSGNSATCSFVITVLETAPRAEVGSDLNICDETSATLNGNDPMGFLGTWNIVSGFGDIESPNSSTTVVTNLGAGENIFTWSIDPQNGCAIDTDTISVFVEPAAELEAGENESIFAGSGTTLTPDFSPPDGTFNWSPEQGLSCTSCEMPTASPIETTLYFLEYTTPLGCVLTDSLLVRVFTELPNTITPDNDGVNDVWNIPNITDFPNVNVLIYNRWGNEVFSSTGYNEPWDGTRNGEELPTGSYFYIINYNESGKESLSGSVNIIR